MESERTLMLRVLGEAMTATEWEELAEALDGTLPEGYNAVLVPAEPRIEAMDKADMRELVREIERAADLEERRPNAKIRDPEEIRPRYKCLRDECGSEDVDVVDGSKAGHVHISCNSCGWLHKDVLERIGGRP